MWEFFGCIFIHAFCTKTVKSIHKLGLRSIIVNSSFLAIFEAEYGDVVPYCSTMKYHTDVKKILDLKVEIDIFMNEQLKPVPEILNPEWLYPSCQLTFKLAYANLLHLLHRNPIKTYYPALHMRISKY